MFVLHASLRANLTVARPEATDEQITEALRHAQLAALVDTLRRGWTPPSATAASACPAGNANGSASPGSSWPTRIS